GFVCCSTTGSPWNRRNGKRPWADVCPTVHPWAAGTRATCRTFPHAAPTEIRSSLKMPTSGWPVRRTPWVLACSAAASPTTWAGTMTETARQGCSSRLGRPTPAPVSSRSSRPSTKAGTHSTPTSATKAVPCSRYRPTTRPGSPRSGTRSDHPPRSSFDDSMTVHTEKVRTTVNTTPVQNRTARPLYVRVGPPTVLLCVLLATACETSADSATDTTPQPETERGHAQEAGLEVSQAWIPEPANPEVGALYLEISNDS